MALFSQGGTSNPDILVIILMATCFLISTFLNPIVFIHNFRKPKSVAVFLFRCLAVFDFVTCIFIPLKVIPEAAAKKCSVEPIRYLEYEVDNRNRSCITRSKPGNDVHVLIKLYSVAAWILILTSNFIAAVMSICRYIQIKFPLFPLPLKPFVWLAVLYETYNLALSGYGSFDRNSFFTVDKQLMASTLGLSRFLMILIHIWPSVICQFASLVTSCLTIHHLYNVHRGTLGKQTTIALRSRKCSLKILITNFGSILTNAIMMLIMMTAGKDMKTNSTAQFISANIVTVLLSCFNPAIFILFTPNVRRDF